MNKAQIAKIALVKLILYGGWALGQTATTNQPAATDASAPAVESKEEKAWSLSASVYTYFVPDDDDYAQPTVTFDHGWLHLEARYNYEDLETDLASISPVANECWVFWEGGRKLLYFASDIDLANPVVWQHEALTARIFDLDEQVVVSHEEAPGSNRFLTRSQVSRALFNCVILGQRVVVPPRLAGQN